MLISYLLIGFLLINSIENNLNSLNSILNSINTMKNYSNYNFIPNLKQINEFFTYNLNIKLNGNIFSPDRLINLNITEQTSNYIIGYPYFHFNSMKWLINNTHLECDQLCKFLYLDSKNCSFIKGSDTVNCSLENKRFPQKIIK